MTKNGIGDLGMHVNRLDRRTHLTARVAWIALSLHTL
jgi:hypothetical protein